jgi:anthranilate synthase component 1
VACGERLPLPQDQAALLATLRDSLARAPRPTAPGAERAFPLAGGLVGYSAYDIVRYFERLPQRVHDTNPVPDLHYIAPRSLLVFDHLTRGIALLHAGTESERLSLRREVVAALRGALPAPRRNGGFTPPVASMSERQFLAGVARTKEYTSRQPVTFVNSSCRCALRTRRDLDPFEAYRALRLRRSFALYVLLRFGRRGGGSAHRPRHW